MGTIDSMKSVLTQSALDALCEKFHIPDVVHSELPGRNDNICNSPTVLCYCGLQGLSFQDLVPCPWFCSDRRKDPLLTPAEFNANVCNYLADNPAPFRKFPKILLMLCWHKGDAMNEGSGDVAVADHVIQDEGAKIVPIEDETQTIVAGKPKVEKERRRADGASGSNHPSKKLKEDHGTSGDVGASTGGKSLAEIQELFEQSTLSVEVGVTAVATMPFVTSSVTPTPERGDGRPTDSMMNFLPFSPAILTTVPDSTILTTVVATTVVVDTSALVHRAGHEPIHHTLFADSTSMGKADLDVADPSHPADTKLSMDSFYVSQDLDSETLHQAYANLLKERDAEIASLKAQLSLKEAEAMEAIHLCSQVAALEFAAITKDTELASSNTHIAKLTQDLSSLQLSYDELSIKASSLESEKDKLIGQVSTLESTCSGLRDEVMGYKVFKEQIKAVKDEQVRVLSDRVAGLDSELMGMALHLDEEFYPWAIGRAIDKEANYIFAVNALRAVDFPLLAQLESHKDANIVYIMGLLHLEGPAAKTPEASQL
ncbi:hypothetical protein Tco_0388682 [Tanacetum coccineum]